MNNLLHSRRLRIFLLFTFPVTWGCWFFLAFTVHRGLVDFPGAAGTILFILGGSAPTVGAYIAVLQTPEEGSIRQFHRRVFSLRISWKWYSFALAAPLLLGLLSRIPAVLLDSNFALRNPITSPLLYGPLFLSAIFLGGIEEFGWRGVFQEAFGRSARLVSASLIIGLFWSFWHLPLFSIPGTNHYGSSFLLYTIAALGYSGLLTRLYAETKSILLTVLLHASINASAGIGAAVPLGEGRFFLLQALLVCAAGTIAVLTYRPSSVQG